SSSRACQPLLTSGAAVGAFIARDYSSTNDGLAGAALGLTLSRMAKRLSIDVWSDIACPWCYVGKRRLENALREFAFADEVEVTWHAFELDPSAPPVRDLTVSHAERLAKKYGTTVERAKAMNERLRGIAREEGLEYDFEHIKSDNTFNAHRL